MEERRNGLSQRIPQPLEPLSYADDEAVMGETDNTPGTTEPEDKPDAGVKRGNRIGWWW